MPDDAELIIADDDGEVRLFLTPGKTYYVVREEGKVTLFNVVQKKADSQDPLGWNKNRVIKILETEINLPQHLLNARGEE